MRTYTIGELVREFDVTPRALRFYEDKDLLHPVRQGVHRVYSHKDRGRLKLILQGKRIGFSLSEIREMLDVYTFSGQRVQLELVLSKFKGQIDKLERQRVDIDNAIASLRDSIGWIEEKLEEDNVDLTYDAAASGLGSPDGQVSLKTGTAR